MLIGGTATATHALSAAIPLLCCRGALFCSLPPSPYRPRDCRASKQSDDLPVLHAAPPRFDEALTVRAGRRRIKLPATSAVQSWLRRTKKKARGLAPRPLAELIPYRAIPLEWVRVPGHEGDQG
jgi:hypothetical protein